MGPFKALLPFAKGFLRFGVLVFAIVHYFDLFKTFNVQNVEWILAALFIIFAFLLFIGGFSKNATLSVISGFIIFAISGYELFRHFKGLDHSLTQYLFSAAIGFYFIARGNRG